MDLVTLLRPFSILILVAGCNAVIDGTCTKCLCEFINESPYCDTRVGCHDGVCGPYALTQEYWTDGGSHGVGGGDAWTQYQNCANDMNCAETTIRDYMNIYHKDCNGDGYEDCFDYASIHFSGPLNCQRPLRERQRAVLHACLTRYNYFQRQPSEYLRYRPFK